MTFTRHIQKAFTETREEHVKHSSNICFYINLIGIELYSSFSNKLKRYNPRKKTFNNNLLVFFIVLWRNSRNRIRGNIIRRISSMTKVSKDLRWFEVNNFLIKFGIICEACALINIHITHSKNSKRIYPTCIFSLHEYIEDEKKEGERESGRR